MQFSQYEMLLANAGAECHADIDVFGADPPGSTSGAKITDFGRQDITVPYMPTLPFTVVAHDKSIEVSNALLNEDSAPLDADEIRCKVRVHYPDLPPAEGPWAYTDQEVIPAN
jgi:hypothetical protein